MNDKTYRTIEAAAKAYGRSQGWEGRVGGWIYRNGVPIAHGWNTLGRSLHASRVITAVRNPVSGPNEPTWLYTIPN